LVARESRLANTPLYPIVVARDWLAHDEPLPMDCKVPAFTKNVAVEVVLADSLIRVLIERAVEA
jgi:hypothetical protein